MNTEDIQGRMLFYNPWWKEKRISSSLAVPFTREVFDQLVSYLQLSRVIVLKGPRRTGKSTMIYQLIAKLLQEKIPAEHIMYLNFEDPLLRVDLHTLLKHYELMSGADLAEKATKYIILDEVQYLPFWAEGVKAYFDKKYPIKFICLGSSSTLIKKGGESLMGRSIEEVVLPFSFREWVNYQRSKKKHQQTITEKNFHLYKSEVEKWGRTYLEHGGFAHILDITDKELLKKLIYEDIIQKVIYSDLVEAYDIREPAVLEKVFYYLVQISGQILNVSSLSQTLSLNRETLRSYLYYLSTAYLYYTLPKYSRSIKQVLGSQEKAYILDPIFSIFGLEKNTNFQWETVVANYFHSLYPKNTYYFREKDEVDLVISLEGNLIPIEIKSADRVQPSDLKGLYIFMEKYNIRKGYVVYRGEDAKIKRGMKEIYLLSGFKCMYLGHTLYP